MGYRKSGARTRGIFWHHENSTKLLAASTLLPQFPTAVKEGLGPSWCNVFNNETAAPFHGHDQSVHREQPHSLVEMNYDAVNAANRAVIRVGLDEVKLGGKSASSLVDT